MTESVPQERRGRRRPHRARTQGALETERERLPPLGVSGEGSTGRRSPPRALVLPGSDPHLAKCITTPLPAPARPSLAQWTLSCGRRSDLSEFTRLARHTPGDRGAGGGAGVPTATSAHFNFGCGGMGAGGAGKLGKVKNFPSRTVPSSRGAAGRLPGPLRSSERSPFLTLPTTRLPHFLDSSRRIK